MKMMTVQAMISTEIAERTGKDHAHVCRDIRNILSELGEDESKFGSVYKGGNGEDRPAPSTLVGRGDQRKGNHESLHGFLCGRITGQDCYRPVNQSQSDPWRFFFWMKKRKS